MIAYETEALAIEAETETSFDPSYFSGSQLFCKISSKLSKNRERRDADKQTDRRKDARNFFTQQKYEDNQEEKLTSNNSSPSPFSPFIVVF